MLSTTPGASRGQAPVRERPAGSLMAKPLPPAVAWPMWVAHNMLILTNINMNVMHPIIEGTRKDRSQIKSP